MEAYDYYACVAKDVKDNLPEWFKWNDINGYAGIGDLVSDIRDDFWDKGGVTGGSVGTYTGDEWVAEENLCHNMSLFLEALEEFGLDWHEYVENGAGYCDVLVRRYVLGQVADVAIREYVAENYPGFGA